MKESYMDFLKSKMVIAPKSGIPINREEISDVLKPHQRDAVYWAVVGGRRALEEEMKHNEPSLFDFINENAG